MVTTGLPRSTRLDKQHGCYEEDDIEYGVNTDSMLSETLQAGDYTIEATTYYAGKQGDFELTIEVNSQ